MAVEFTTRRVAEGELPAWDAFVASAPGGSVYSTSRYLDALCSVTDARFRVLATERDGEIVGGVALYERSSPVGSYVAPRLLLYYNGIVLGATSTRYPSKTTSRDLKVLDQLERATRGLGHASVRLHARESLTDVRLFLERGWSARPSYSYVVDLSDPSEALERVEGNFRRLIRRCENEGLSLVRDDDFESFHALHLQTHRRKGAPLYLPRREFRRYFDRLSADGPLRLYHARDGQGRSLAAQLVLAQDHPVTHTVCAGADEENLQSGASVFLRWKVCERLAAEGFGANDLTDAALNPVTRFKSQLGGRLELSFGLASPVSPAWRAYSGATQVLRLGRRAVSFARRRLPGGGR